jgi:hypothetical protein
MAKVMYALCELSRRVEDGFQVTQRWLPVQFAVEGRHVRLKHAGGWQDQWRVDSAGGEARPESYLVDRSRAHVGHQRNDGR